MATFTEMMAKARKRNKGESKSARFREILEIVHKHKVREGLPPEKAVRLIEDLGPTFVKLGQIASTHPDMLPAEYCDAFGQLRTHVAPMDFATVEAQVEKELGKPLTELFSAFGDEAVGSASIAQVHRAVLPDGATEVAVKVQRPNVIETVTDDLAILEQLVDLYDLVSRGDGKLSLKELVDELVRTSTEELDFLNEAANLERFRQNSEGREGVSSPRCYRELTTSAVLTEDFAGAPCIERIDELGLGDDARDRVAYLIASNYMAQMMEDGFYHADPHAGNVLVTPEGGIEWIDFGMMGEMTASQRAVMGELIAALVKGDSYGLKRALLKVATPRGPIDHGKLLDTCEGMVGQFVNVDLDSFDTGALIGSFSDALAESGFDIDPFLVSLGRGLVTLEGTIHLVSPRLNIMQVLVDYAKSSFDLGAIERKVRKAVGASIESAEAMAELPTRAIDTLDMLQKGQVKIGMELSANERFSRDLRTAASIMALALIAMALIIGACILGASDLSPRLGGVSVAGGAGLLAGIVIAVYVLLKTRKYLK